MKFGLFSIQGGAIDLDCFDFRKVGPHRLVKGKCVLDPITVDYARSALSFS